jgi:WD40 repeat protein
VVDRVCFSLDGQRLASASWDQTVRVWDASSGAELLQFQGHTDRLQSVCFSPDGQRLASASWDQTVRVWDASSGACLEVHEGIAAPDLRAFAAGPWSAPLRAIKRGLDAVVEEAATAHPVARFPAAPPYGGFTSSPSGRNESGVELLCIDKHRSIDWPTIAVAFSPDGRRLVSTGDDTVRVWDAETCVEQRCLQGHKGYVGSVCYSVDGQRLVTGGEKDKTVRIWDAASGVEQGCLRGHEKDVSAVMFSLNGRRVISGSDDTTVRIWDASSCSELFCLKGHSGRVNCLACSPDGRWIASGSQDKTVRIWDTESGAELAVLGGHEKSVGIVSFSSDGRRIASGSDDMTVRIWDANTFKCLAVIPGIGDVSAIAAGSRMFPWRMMARGLETVIEDAATGQVMAWSPFALDLPSLSPSASKPATSERPKTSQWFGDFLSAAG